MVMRVSEAATLFLRRERAEGTARAFERGGKRRAEVILAERIEADKSRSVGWAVRYREPLGEYQLA